MADEMTEPLLIGIEALAKLLQRSAPSLCRDDLAGRLPAPVRIGRSKRWRLDEIREWVAAGAPEREAWKALCGKGVSDERGRL